MIANSIFVACLQVSLINAAPCCPVGFLADCPLWPVTQGLPISCKDHPVGVDAEIHFLGPLGLLCCMQEDVIPCLAPLYALQGLRRLVLCVQVFHTLFSALFPSLASPIYLLGCPLLERLVDFLASPSLTRPAADLFACHTNLICLSRIFLPMPGLTLPLTNFTRLFIH